MVTKIEITLEQSQQVISNDVLVRIKEVEELKRNVWINGEKKEALPTLKAETRSIHMLSVFTKFPKQPSPKQQLEPIQLMKEDLPSRKGPWWQGRSRQKDKDLKISDEKTKSKDNHKRFLFRKVVREECTLDAHDPVKGGNESLYCDMRRLCPGSNTVIKEILYGLNNMQVYFSMVLGKFSGHYVTYGYIEFVSSYRYAYSNDESEKFDEDELLMFTKLTLLPTKDVGSPTKV
nr:lung seven transmembrane receptor family protein [Tanacetum cinerariifolium]